MHPPTQLLLAIVLMIALHVLAPIVRLAPTPWNALGALPLVFGIVWNLWADRAFKRAGTTVKPDERSSALVVEGPYAMSRHPMYLGMIAVLAGVALLCGTLSPMLIVPLFAGIIALRFVPMEERKMEETFGDAWREYARRVRKWI